MNEAELKKLLIAENEEFRKIYEEHQACENELAKIREKTYPSGTDAVVERNLKKKKLALKDKMYRMMHDFGRTSG